MGITGGIDTEERSRSTATKLKKESPSSHSMKTAIVLVSIALLAGISNHGCKSAAANEEPKINSDMRARNQGHRMEAMLEQLDKRINDIKQFKEMTGDDRGIYDYVNMYEFDDWIAQTDNTMEDRMDYLEKFASYFGHAFTDYMALGSTETINAAINKLNNKIEAIEMKI